jgi:hypothetical protein
MVLRVIAILLLTMLGVSCREEHGSTTKAAQKNGLTKDSAQIIDAVAFALFGHEEGGKFDQHSDATERTIRGTEIAYAMITKNLSFGDDKQADLRESQYWRTELRISSPAACTFNFLHFSAYSTGLEKTEFRAKPFENEYQIDLQKAHRFEIERPLAEVPGYVELWIEGMGVLCRKGVCENSFANHLIADSEEERRLVVRRQGAIDFIKKACPGKPY